MISCEGRNSMQLSDMIKAFKEEKEEWPATPESLLEFCEYKYHVGEIDYADYQFLFSTLHKNKIKYPFH